MKRKLMIPGIQILIVSFLMSINGCLVDIPNVRPEGPSIIVYGKVTNNQTNTPIKNVVISDGFSTTITNSQGYYSIKTFSGATHVFVSVPEPYEIPIKDGMPQIFNKINLEKDSVQVNFNLKPLANGVENDFTLIALADPQVQNANHMRRFKNETIPDLKNTLKEYNNVYGVTLGDIAYDSLKVLGEMKQVIISTDIPFFHTIGNHDFSTMVYEPDVASKEFVSHFGPLDYSFNRGKAHIVILNNVFNYGVASYNWGFSAEQIKWLESDLQHVPKDKMLIICVHIPVFPTSSMERKTEFLEAISGYSEVHILSGHWHANRNYINTEYRVFEHLTGTASGMWWGSTINKCGAPNGYGVYEISGNKMKNWYYKGVRYDKDFQVRMIKPNTLGEKGGHIVANVWNYDTNWKVELYENGVNSGQMERFTDYAPEVYAFMKSLNISENTNYYQKSVNLFRMKPNNPSAEFTIKATDGFGNVYTQSLAINEVSPLRSY